MYKNNPLLFIRLLCILFFSARCRKHDCSNDKPRQVLIPQEVLDFVDFKAGTYWIYQDSATGRIDSEVVVNSRHYIEDVTGFNDCGSIATMRQYENIEMIIERYDSLGNKKDSWVREFNNEAKINNPKEDNIFYINNYNSFEIGYPYNISYYNQGYLITETLSDSLILNGMKFYNILKWVGQSGTDYINYAMAKKIGKLYVGTTGTTPNKFQKNILIRYKIM